jgi:hypothetical protein
MTVGTLQSCPFLNQKTKRMPHLGGGFVEVYVLEKIYDIYIY